MAAQEEDHDLIVNRDLPYPIVVGDDTHPALQAFLRGRGQPFVVLTDERPDVLRIAGRLRQDANCLGLRAFRLGERRKRLRLVEAVQDALVETGADRETLIVGVGGGIASDAFGFAAATYMRGVAYVHVATSLVAMVDAAVGGKTGVDLRGGKNLCGAFSDPAAVFAPAHALRTLPYRALREGLAEMLKAAIVEGDAFFEALETLAPHPFWRWPWRDVVAEAVKVKTMIVADDREERGIRELLNLGHTFAHGLEHASGYRITHGAAVALGLRAAGILAMRTGRFSQSEHLRVLGTMSLLRMPLVTTADPVAVLRSMQADKKKRRGELRFVLPRAIGDVERGVTVSERYVRETLEALAHPPGRNG